jgi:hypothetical protein
VHFRRPNAGAYRARKRTEKIRKAGACHCGEAASRSIGQRSEHLGGAAQLVVVELGQLDVDPLQQAALASAAIAAACMS